MHLPATGALGASSWAPLTCHEALSMSLPPDHTQPRVGAVSLRHPLPFLDSSRVLEKPLCNSHHASTQRRSWIRACTYPYVPPVLHVHTPAHECMCLSQATPSSRRNPGCKGQRLFRRSLRNNERFLPHRSRRGERTHLIGNANALIYNDC